MYDTLNRSDMIGVTHVSKLFMNSPETVD